MESERMANYGSNDRMGDNGQLLPTGNSIGSLIVGALANGLRGYQQARDTPNLQQFAKVLGADTKGMDLSNTPVGANAMEEALENPIQAAPPPSGVSLGELVQGAFGPGAVKNFSTPMESIPADSPTAANYLRLLSTVKMAANPTNPSEMPANVISRTPPINKGTGRGNSRDPNDDFIQGIGAYLSSIKGAYDDYLNNNLYEPNASNRLGAGVASFFDKTKHPVASPLASALAPANVASNLARWNQSNILLTKLFGGSTRGLPTIMSTLQPPSFGTGKDKINELYNQRISTVQNLIQGRLDNLELTDPRKAQELSNQVNSLFGKFGVGKSGPGVATAPNTFPAPQGNPNVTMGAAAPALTEQEKAALGAYANDPAMVAKVIAARGQ
jgi:hypothetical protein